MNTASVTNGTAWMNETVSVSIINDTNGTVCMSEKGYVYHITVAFGTDAFKHLQSLGRSADRSFARSSERSDAGQPFDRSVDRSVAH